MEVRRYPFEDSEISVRAARAPARSSEALDALPRSNLPHSRRLKNFRRPRGPFVRISSLDLGRLGSILGPADAPGFDFGRQNASILQVFRRSCTFGANFVRIQQNTVKTDVRGTSELPRNKTKATKKRSKGTFEAAWCTTGARTAHREGLGASSGRPWDAFGRLLAALGSPGAPQDRLWGGIWASKSDPERVRTRPGNGLGHPKRPKIDFSSIWGGFSSIFD